MKTKTRAQEMGGDLCLYFATKNRATGTTTAVFDLREKEMVNGVYYLVKCITHKKVFTGSSLQEEAFLLAANPGEFCTECAAIDRAIAGGSK